MNKLSQYLLEHGIYIPIYLDAVKYLDDWKNYIDAESIYQWEIEYERRLIIINHLLMADLGL